MFTEIFKYIAKISSSYFVTILSKRLRLHNNLYKPREINYIYLNTEIQSLSSVIKFEIL